MTVRRDRGPALDRIGEHHHGVVDAHLAMTDLAVLIGDHAQLAGVEYLLEERDRLGRAVHDEIRRYGRVALGLVWNRHRHLLRRSMSPCNAPALALSPSVTVPPPNLVVEPMNPVDGERDLRPLGMDAAIRTPQADAAVGAR
jgi:hypothetical protein